MNIINRRWAEQSRAIKVYLFNSPNGKTCRVAFANGPRDISARRVLSLIILTNNDKRRVIIVIEF